MGLTDQQIKELGKEVAKVLLSKDPGVETLLSKPGAVVYEKRSELAEPLESAE